jgi:hypothetical protein
MWYHFILIHNQFSRWTTYLHSWGNKTWLNLCPNAALALYWNLRSIEKKWWSAINRIDLWFQFLTEQRCSNFVDKNYSLGMLCFFAKHECVKIATPLADHRSSNSKKVKRKSNDSHLDECATMSLPTFLNWRLRALISPCNLHSQIAGNSQKERG